MGDEKEDTVEIKDPIPAEETKADEAKGDEKLPPDPDWSPGGTVGDENDEKPEAEAIGDVA